MKQPIRRLLALSAAAVASALAACSDAPPAAPSIADPSAAVMPSLSFRNKEEKERLEAEREAQKEQLKALKRASKEEFEAAKKLWKLRKKQLKNGAALEFLECEPKEMAFDVEIIGPDGGHLDVAGHKLEIPRNALSENVVIRAVAPMSPGREIQFEPHGLVFAKSPVLTMSFKGCFLPEERFRPQVAYVDDDYNILELPQTIPATFQDETLRAWIDHFSGYVVAHTRVTTRE